MTKPDFSKIFAQNGAIMPLTDNQFLQGFDYLGASPPTKEEFNWLFQQFCLKLQYLNENSGLNLWQPEHTYAIGDICYSKIATSYKYMECTVAGTTAAMEPTWPTVGQEITDGTCKWRVRDIKSGGGVPIGTITARLSKTPAPGELACDAGSLVSRATYPDLWAWVQANAPLITESEWQAQAAVQSSVGYYSTGDGNTTFRLPRLLDYRRGGLASEVGQWQADMFKSHTHSVTGGSLKGAGGTGVTVLDGYMPDETTKATGGTETRPKTIKFLFCVKAFDAPVNQGMIDITALANSMASKIDKSDIGYGTKLWISGEYAPIFNTPTIVSHGLTINPINVKCDVLFKCIVAEGGYAVGDFATGLRGDTSTSEDSILNPPFLDSTVIRVNTGAYGTGLIINRKDNSAAYFAPTLANWRYIFRIWY